MTNQTRLRVVALGLAVIAITAGLAVSMLVDQINNCGSVIVPSSHPLPDGMASVLEQMNDLMYEGTDTAFLDEVFRRPSNGHRCYVSLGTQAANAGNMFLGGAAVGSLALLGAAVAVPRRKD